MGAGFFAEAFVELQHDRNEYGFIPFTAIESFARRYRLRGGLYEQFRRVIRQVNVAINEHLEAKRKAERKAGNGNAG